MPEGILRSVRGLDCFIQQVHQLHGKRKNYGRILLDTYLGKRLKITELDGHGLGGEKGGGVDELLGGVEFAFGMDDLGAALALGLGLLGHGAEHGLGQVDLLDLDGDDFYAEGGGVAVDDGLDALIEAFAVGEKLIELDFAEDGAKGGLGELAGLVDIVGDFDDGPGGFDDAESDDGVDLEGDVVAGDDVLRGDFHSLLTEGDADDLVEGAEDEDDAGAFGVLADATETEDDPTLILFEDFDGADEVKSNDDNDKKDGSIDHGDLASNLPHVIVRVMGKRVLG